MRTPARLAIATVIATLAACAATSGEDPVRTPATTTSAVPPAAPLERSAEEALELPSAPFDALLLGIACGPDGRAVVVGGVGPQSASRGVIRSTTDGGRRWEDTEVASAPRLYGVAIDASGVAVAVGLGGCILRSDGALTSWSRCDGGGDAWLNGIAAPRPACFFAIGNARSGPILLESVDGGATWTNRSSILRAAIDAAAPRAIAFSDEAHGWIVGQEGRAVRTSDGGASWTIVETGTAAPLRAVHVLDRDRGVIGGFECILWTDDGGATWRRSEHPATKVNGVLRLDDERAVATTMAGAVLRTIDGGRTWQPVPAASRTTSLTASCFDRSGAVIVVGEHGYVARIDAVQHRR